MDLKKQAANYALKYVKDGMLLGLGSGSTSSLFVQLLGERLQEGALKDIRGVPTSQDTARLAHQVGISLIHLADCSPHGGAPALDLAVDGADEVDPRLNLIKGLGRAALREKIVEMHARHFLVIGDASKAVPQLGRGPLPVEIVTFEYQVHVAWLNSLGCRAELWHEADGSPIVTDNGNYLVRCWFENGIPDAYALARTLADRPGIVEHGLFLDMAHEVILAGSDGMQIMERN